EALRAGVSGAGPITLFDPCSLATRIAAEVKGPAPGFRDRKIGFALEAAEEAMAAASACGTRPRDVGGIAMGLGLELFSMEDLAASRRPGFALPGPLGERLAFLQTPSDLALHLIARR